MRIKTTTRTEYQQRINVLIEYINNHLGEDIDLNKLAEISGFSRWHFHRIFAEFLGEPVGTFIVRMRVETAARLLRYTEIPVKEIAYKVGYDVPSSLSKVFRQFYGISPNEYRNNKDYVIMEPNRIMPDMELKVEVKDLPGKQVAYIRLNGGYKEIDYPGTWMRLLQFAKEQNIQPLSFSPICLYHDDPKVTSPDKLRTDICMEVAPSVCPKGEIGTKKVLEGRFMVALYKGTYQQLGAVYDTLYGKYLPEMGLSLREVPSGEIYLNDPCNTKPEDLLTQIYVAIE
ncbi:AraC family transcriptional regulator [Parabacteroides sp.]